MKTICKLVFLFLLVSQASFSQKRHFGNYFNNWRYWGPMFTLKADSTFDYVIRTLGGETIKSTKDEKSGITTTTTDVNIFTDSSYGTYTILNDTVFLNYATKEIEGDFDGANIRSTKLFWKGKSLYYIWQNGFVLRQKYYYMKWSKLKAYSLSKADEKWGINHK